MRLTVSPRPHKTGAGGRNKTKTVYWCTIKQSNVHLPLYIYMVTMTEQWPLVNIYNKWQIKLLKSWHVSTVPILHLSMFRFLVGLTRLWNSVGMFGALDPLFWLARSVRPTSLTTWYLFIHPASAILYTILWRKMFTCACTPPGVHISTAESIRLGTGCKAIDVKAFIDVNKSLDGLVTFVILLFEPYRIFMVPYYYIYNLLFNYALLIHICVDTIIYCWENWK